MDKSFDMYSDVSFDMVTDTDFDNISIQCQTPNLMFYYDSVNSTQVNADSESDCDGSDLEFDDPKRNHKSSNKKIDRKIRYKIK